MSPDRIALLAATVARVSCARLSVGALCGSLASLPVCLVASAPYGELTT